MKRLTTTNENDDIELVINKERIRVKDSDTLIATKKLKEYEDLEEALENAYGDCPDLLKTVVETLVTRANEINDAMGQKPIKAKLLTDEDVDTWTKYKQLEIQGKLLPCKAGDTIWYVDTDNDERFMTEITVSEIRLLANMHVQCIGENNDGQFMFDSSDFGKIVFTVREEAEEKYKELGSIKDE